MKCPAWVAATLSGSFNKGVIYRQHGGFAAFSDSHVSVWTEPHTRQKDRVNSLGSTGPKYTLWLVQFCAFTVINLPSEASGRQLLHTCSSLQVFGKGAVDWNAVQCCCFVVCACVCMCVCLLVFLSSGVSHYRLAGFCQSGEGCWWRGNLLAKEGCKWLLSLESCHGGGGKQRCIALDFSFFFLLRKLGNNIVLIY